MKRKSAATLVPLSDNDPEGWNHDQWPDPHSHPAEYEEVMAWASRPLSPLTWGNAFHRAFMALEKLRRERGPKALTTAKLKTEYLKAKGTHGKKVNTIASSYDLAPQTVYRRLVTEHDIRGDGSRFEKFQKRKCEYCPEIMQPKFAGDNICHRHPEARARRR